MAPRIPTEDDNEEVEDRLQDGNVEDEADDEGEQVGVAEDDEDQGNEEAEDGLAARSPRRDTSQRETATARAQRLAREARAEADAARREAAEIRAEIQRLRQPQQETPEQEAARLSLMEPEQRVEYRFNKALENQNRQTARLQAQLADQSDKSAFQLAASADPLLKSVAADVEKELAKVRAMGQNVDREALANYLIGKRARERGGRAVVAQRNVGQRNIQRQTTRPAGGRSDRGPEDRRSNDARRARLEDVVF